MKALKLVGTIALVVVLAAAGGVVFLMQFRPQAVPFSVAEIDTAAGKTGLADCFWWLSHDAMEALAAESEHALAEFVVPSGEIIMPIGAHIVTANKG